MSPRGRSRALVAMSSSTCGSWSSRLIVGGRRGGAAPARSRPPPGPGAAEQVAGHRLGAGDDDLGGVLAERGVQHQALGDVALGRRGGVGVDVRDVGRADVRLVQRAQDRAGAAAALRVGLGDVVGVGGDAGAEHLGVDPRAAGPGVLLGLEHQHAGALAEDEPVAGGVPRAGDRGRVAAVGPLAVFDSAIMLANAAIGSGWIAASVPPATTTSARPSRIWSTARAIASLPEAQAETGVFTAARAPTYRLMLRRRGVGHQHRHRQGGDPAGALLLERVVVVQQRRDAADARGHRDAEPVVSPARRPPRPASGPGLHGRDHRELRGAVQAAGLDPFEDLGGLDGDAAGDLDRHLLGPVVGQAPDTGASGDQGVPGAGHVTADGGGGPEAGDDDSLATCCS